MRGLHGLIFLGRWEHAVEEGHKGLRTGEEFADNSVIVLCGLASSRGPIPPKVTWYGRSNMGSWRSRRPRHLRTKCGLRLPWLGPGAGVASHAEGLKSKPRSSRCNALHASAYGEIFTLFLGEGYWLAGEYDNATQTLEEHLAIAERMA